MADYGNNNVVEQSNNSSNMDLSINPNYVHGKIVNLLIQTDSYFLVANIGSSQVPEANS